MEDFPDDGGFAQIGSFERNEAIIGIEKLDAVLILIEKSSGDGDAFFRHGAEMAVLREHFGVGIDQRALQFGGEQISIAAQVRSDARADASDAMTTGAVSFAVIDRFPASGIASRRRGRRGSGDGSWCRRLW